MKILIGYDGSESADAMLADLRRAGLPQDAETSVISVAELWLLPLPTEPGNAEISQLAFDEMEILSLRAADRIRSYFPNWTVSSKAMSGSPAMEILTSADEWKPDLIVVGSQGRSAINRFFFGSVSQKVVTEAGCSVRVARGKEEAAEPVRIIIGVDGSEGSDAAVRAVEKRVWPAHTQVRLVTSVGLHTTGNQTAMALRTIEQQKEYVKSIHLARESDLRSIDLVVSSVIEEGDPKRTLLLEAEKWKADCIFVGSRGIGRLKRFLLGSVSTAVVARACCSVEVVRSRE